MLYLKSLLVMLLLIAQLQSTAFAAPGETVNVNTATAEQLAQTLDGVGQSRAQAIVQYRESNGDFISVDELLAVRGIGESVLANNRDRIVLQ